MSVRTRRHGVVLLLLGDAPSYVQQHPWGETWAGGRNIPFPASLVLRSPSHLPCVIFVLLQLLHFGCRVWLTS